MNDLLQKYKEFLEARQASKNYYNIMRIWLGFLEAKGIKYNEFTQQNITDFFVEHSKYKETSRNQFIKSGRNFYTAFLQIPKEQNQWYKIKLIKVEYKIPDYLSEKEIEQGIAYLITYHSRTMQPCKIRALFHFMFYSAPRKQEVLNLKRTDFNIEEGWVKLYGKGKKERYSYYPNRVAKEIKEYFDSEVETKNAFNISLMEINYYPKLMGKYLGKNVYCHLIRHSSCREMLRKGIPIAVASKILGHTRVTTTIRYADENEEGRRNIYKDKIK